MYRLTYPTDGSSTSMRSSTVLCLAVTVQGRALVPVAIERIRTEEAARLGKPEGAGACCLGLRGRGASIGLVPHRYHIGSHRAVIGRGATLSAW